MKKLAKILLALLVVFVVVFLILHAVSSPSTQYRTETATLSVVDDSVTLNGAPVRPFTTVDQPGQGVVRYLVSDGSKVAKGQVLGLLYADDNQARAGAEIARLETIKTTLEEAEKSTASLAGQYDTLTARMNQTLLGAYGAIAMGETQNLFELRLAYLDAGVRRELGVDSSAKVTDTVASLNRQIATLQKTVTTAPVAIKAPKAGFFNRARGLFLTKKQADKLDAAGLAKLLEQSQNTALDRVGIISTENEWNYLGLCNSTLSKRIKEGDTVTLTLHGSNRMPATVLSVADTENGSMVRVACDYTALDLGTGGAVTMIINSYEGLQLPKSALRFEGNTPGVYVKGLSAIQFKKVNLLFQNESILVAANNTTDQDHLRLYDEVIVSGAELYDGKPVG